MNEKINKLQKVIFKIDEHRRLKWSRKSYRKHGYNIGGYMHESFIGAKMEAENRTPKIAVKLLT